MQTIDSTFNAYKLPGFDDIWNPVHNAIAAIRYSISRYGSIANVPGIKAMASGKGYVGYATGTNYHNGGDAVLGDGGEEEPYLTPDGRFGISPKIPTLFKNFPAGSKVWPSIKKMKQDFSFFATGTDSKVPIAGTAAIQALLNIAKSTKQSSDSSATRQTNNDQSQVIMLLQQQNQLLFKMLQNMQKPNTPTNWKELTDKVNQVGGSKYSINGFMTGEGIR